jgi:hypothetical protein
MAETSGRDCPSDQADKTIQSEVGRLSWRPRVSLLTAAAVAVCAGILSPTLPLDVFRAVEQVARDSCWASRETPETTSGLLWPGAGPSAAKGHPLS